MVISKNIIFSILLIFFILVQNSCFSTKVQIQYIDNQQITNGINNSLNNEPQVFNVIHHAVIDLGGKSYVLKGYITINRQEDRFAINAQNNFGGSVFKINCIKNSFEEIITPINVFKKSWLKNSVMKDIEYLYFSKPFSSPKLAVHDKDSFKLIQQNKDNISEERIFSRFSGEGKYILKSYIRKKSNKIIYRIDLKYKKHLMKNFPNTIYIMNKKMRYTVKISALYL